MRQQKTPWLITEIFKINFYYPVHQLHFTGCNLYNGANHLAAAQLTSHDSKLCYKKNMKPPGRLKRPIHEPFNFPRTLLANIFISAISCSSSSFVSVHTQFTCWKYVKRLWKMPWYYHVATLCSTDCLSICPTMTHKPLAQSWPKIPVSNLKLSFLHWVVTGNATFRWKG